MVILHSSFLIDVQDSFQTGLMQLRLAKKCNPSFLERYAIFSREQQMMQQAAGGAKVCRCRGVHTGLASIPLPHPHPAPSESTL